MSNDLHDDMADAFIYAMYHLKNKPNLTKWQRFKQWVDKCFARLKYS